jgi:hypothetical protein
MMADQSYVAFHKVLHKFQVLNEYETSANRYNSHCVGQLHYLLLLLMWRAVLLKMVGWIPIA